MSIATDHFLYSYSQGELTIESAGKQYKRHAGENRYRVTFKARHYWFGLDSGLLDSGSGLE